MKEVIKRINFYQTSINLKVSPIVDNESTKKQKVAVDIKINASYPKISKIKKGDFNYKCTAKLLAYYGDSEEELLRIDLKYDLNIVADEEITSKNEKFDKYKEQIRGMFQIRYAEDLGSIMSNTRMPLKIPLRIL